MYIYIPIEVENHVYICISIEDIYKPWSNGLDMDLILREHPMVVGSSQPTPLVFFYFYFYSLQPKMTQGGLEPHHPWHQKGVRTILKRRRQRRKNAKRRCPLGMTPKRCLRARLWREMMPNGVWTAPIPNQKPKNGVDGLLHQSAFSHRCLNCIWNDACSTPKRIEFLTRKWRLNGI